MYYFLYHVVINVYHMNEFKSFYAILGKVLIIQFQTYILNLIKKCNPSLTLKNM